MAKIVKFIYLMIIFLSPFLVSTKILEKHTNKCAATVGLDIYEKDKCVTDFDCVKNLWLCPIDQFVRCIDETCKCILF
ncbi:putative Late nodulin [Medicago truncatula]|uniref:Nodule Cysteine-Rich (NCR) secreted peptide n=1 Tax=Medicago truncatula TaxID=3880 RepID=G7JAL7_MEDTR|nr:Nodule Cysteine-Rich (NCR) secreted peptide [Medicago truncatula]RHN68345.1 putative Late nodulin [Medicago truncatula]